MLDKQKKQNKPFKSILFGLFAVLLFFGLLYGLNTKATTSETQIRDGFSLEQITDKKDYKMTELPVIDFQLKKQRGFWAGLGAGIKGVFKDEYRGIKIDPQLALQDSQIEAMPNLEVKYLKNGKFRASFKEKPRQFKPGAYSLEFAIKDDALTGGKTLNFTQDFNWGVLAINFNKSIFKKGDDAYIQMAVLDEHGSTVCNADLDLEINTPGILGGTDNLSTKSNTIVRNPACGADNVIDTPDYYLHYKVLKNGVYNLKLTATTKNGVYEIADSFEVKDGVVFEVERTGPTRIYPKANYTMGITVKANEDFKGDIIEPMPLDFQIIGCKSNNINCKFETATNSKEKLLVLKNIEIKKGETVNVLYTFDAPNVSPEFYLLGPLQLQDAKQKLVVENRQWQIASDAVAQHFIARRVAEQTVTTAGWSNITGTANAGTTQSGAGWIAGSNFTIGKKYLLMVWGYYNGSNANTNYGMRVTHGATPTAFLESTSMEEPDQTGVGNKTPYHWFTVWTAANEDINVQAYTAGTARVQDVTLVAIDVDSMVASGDLVWNMASSTGGTLTTTPTSKTSINWTPKINNDNWLIDAYTRADIVIAGSFNYRARLNIDAGTTVSLQDIEGEDANDSPVYGLGWAKTMTKAAHSAAVEISEDGADQQWFAAGVMALNLSEFQDSAIFASTTPVSLTYDDVYYRTAGVTYTPKTAGDWLSMTGFMADDNGGVVSALMRESMIDITAVGGGYTHNALDIEPYTAADIASFSTAEKVIETYARQTASTTAAATYPWIAAFSMELKSPPTSYFNSAQQRNDGTGRVDISMEVADVDWEDTRVMIEYATGTTCVFTTPADPTLSTVDADTTADTGDPDIDNAYPYQIGTTSAYILTDSGANTVDFDWLSMTDRPTATGTTYCLRITADDVRKTQTNPATTTVYIDNVAPTITQVTTSNLPYKIGDSLRATVTVATDASVYLLADATTINGASTTNLQKVNDTTYTLDYVVVEGDADRATGTIPYSVVLSDAYGNKNTAFSGIFGNGSVDAHAPAISAVTAPDLMYGIGDTMRATVTVASDVSIYTMGDSTMNGKTATNLQKVNNTTYTIDYVVAENDTDRASGTIPVSIVLRDAYGNLNTAFTVLTSNASLDAHRPVISAVYIANAAYGIGSNVSLSISSDDRYYVSSGSTINTKAISPANLTDNNDNTYSMIYTVQENDPDRQSGTIPVSIVLQDLYGNDSVAFTAPSSNIASIDAHRPEILAISLSNVSYKIGDTVRATTTVTAPTFVDSYTLGTTTINGVTAQNLVKVNESTYTFDYIVQAGNTDRPAGTIPISLMLVDGLGQYNNPASTTVTANTASIDANKPTISGVTILPTSGILKVGATATATISTVGNELNMLAGSTMTINDVGVAGTFASIGGGQYRVVYTVQEGQTDRLDADDLPVNFIIKDPSGNESDAYMIADAGNRPGVDANTTSITNVFFEPTSGVLKVGSVATATITAFNYETGLLVGSTMTINGINVSGSFAEIGGGQYRVVYTVQEGQTDRSDAVDLPVNFTLKDVNGNQSVNYTAADIANRPGVDANTTSITNVVFAPTSGVLKVGSVATATITAFNNETGLLVGDTMTINGVGVSGTFTEIGGGQYRVVYTVQEGQTDRSDAVDLPINFNIRDAAGNQSPNYTTANADNRPGIDAHTPGISSVSFLPTSGILKIGDKATATIVSLGNETGLSSSTLTINGVNVSNSFIEVGGGQYRVVYTVTEGDADLADFADLPINFVIKDSAGNISSAYVTADVVNRPGVDANRPVISSVVFVPSSGVLKIGDVATATITMAGGETGLSGNSLTVNGVSVIGSFAEIGGGQYRVAYTVAEGNTDRLDTADLPINFTIKDPAGNISTAFNTADANNRPGVDANKPVISSVVFAPSSGILKVGDTATATISTVGNETGLLVGNTVTINGVSVIGSFVEIGGGQYRVTYTVQEGQTDRSDAVDLPIVFAVSDVAGNQSLNYTTADSDNRPGVDANTPTAPGNLSFARNANNSITLLFGATTTESNFQEYKIFYKAGISGVSEGDSDWTMVDDAHLGNINFSGATTTTVTGLLTETDYVFNIYAYDQAGNKSFASSELMASTNHKPINPGLLLQSKYNGNTIASSTWLSELTAYLSATSSDADGDGLTQYFELLSNSGSFTTSTATPAGACNSGDVYGSCTSKIWKTGVKSDWYNNNWLYRKQIRIDGDKIVSTETDFPILVSVTDADLRHTSFGGHVASSTGADFVITDSDGVTPLNYEREKYSASTGELSSWVKTNVTARTSKVFYIYYGNAGVTTDQATTTGVWDNNFVTVQHMADNTTVSTQDSTKNGFTCTKASAGNPVEVAGQIGQAQYLTSDTMSCGNFGTPTSYTAEAWIKASTTDIGTGDISTYGRTVFASALNGSGYPLWLTTRGTEVRHWAYTNNSLGYYTTVGANLNATDKFHIVVEASISGAAKIFVNGNLMAASTSGATPFTNIFTIGDLRPTRLIYFDGMVDEVRFSSSTRSSGWIKTSYNNQSNPSSFAFFSQEENYTPTVDKILVNSLSESAIGYKWQVITCDEKGACSDWVVFDNSVPNFYVDLTAPTAPGNLTFNARTNTSLTLNLGATSTDTSFDQYRVYYKKAINGVTEGDSLFDSSNDPNLGYVDFNGGTTVTIDNLTASSTYVFNIWAYDKAGHRSNATEYATSTEKTTNRPVALFNSVGQKTDGSGGVDVSVNVNDLENDSLRLKLELSTSSACVFTTPLDMTFDESAENISADVGSVLIDNNSNYQIGTSTGWITVVSEGNNVNFDWLSKTDLPNQSGLYCLRMKANDSYNDQLNYATTTVYIDNINPTAPGQLSLNRKDTYSLDLNFGASTTEENFDYYKIFYKEGVSGVSESNTELVDAALTLQNYNNKATTTATPLSAGTAYVFNIWAYDIYGNRSSSTEVNYETNYIPQNPSTLMQLKNDGVTGIVNNEWTNEDLVKLRSSVLDTDTSETLTTYYQFVSNADNLTIDSSEPVGACASGTDFDSCLTKFWKITSSSGDYSVTPFSGQVTISNIPDSATGYKWQTLTCDDNNICSSWVEMSFVKPNVKIDTVLPTKPGDMSLNKRTSNSITLNFGASTTESNFREYKVYYRQAASGVTESDNLHGSSTDANLNYQDFNGATTTTISGLLDNTQYVFNIWAYDLATNKNKATEVAYFTNARPTGAFSTVNLRTNGTGVTDISIQVNDINKDNSRAKLEYVAGAGCNFGVALRPTLDQTDENATSTQGDAKVLNSNNYQIGNDSGWILTDGANTVNVDWLSQLNLDDQEGVYCLRLTANDGLDDQAVYATTTVYVDNLAPTKPGSLGLHSQTADSITLNFGATTTETNFTRYRIFYREGAGIVVETDLEKVDGNLNNIVFNGASTTTVLGLLPNTQYSFRIWAYDAYGNKTESDQVIYTTNAPPVSSFNSVAQKTNGSGVIDISIDVYDTNGDTCVVKVDYVSGGACNFSSPLDPTLDESQDNISSDYGVVGVANVQAYQIGTSTRIITSSGANTINFDWPSRLNLPNANGVYCLRLTANDGADDQLVLATTTVLIDNVAPTRPGELTSPIQSGISVTVGFGATSTDTNFSDYRIYYKQGVSGVTDGDTEFNFYDDPNLGNVNFGNATTTLISGLHGNTAYVFNIWAYDLYGNNSSSTVELATSTVPILSATWREAEDIPDPATGNYLGRQENIRVRLALANSGEWTASNYQYHIEYGVKNGTCQNASDWTTVPVGGTNEEFVIMDSVYFDNGATTSSKLSNDGYSFVEGRMVKSPATTTQSITLASGQKTEVEFVFEATNNSRSGLTYCFRAVDSGGVLDTYGVYPELTMSPPPTATFNSALQKDDASQIVDISIDVSDFGKELNVVKIQYVEGASCDFASPFQTMIDTASDKISADFGNPQIDNDYPYQIGTTTNKIITRYGPNTVNFDWRADQDLIGKDTTYCLRAIANDGYEDQTTPATTTVVIDQISPTIPGDLVFVDKTSNSATWRLATSTDTHFKEYRIYYKEGTSGVTESDLMWASSSDINLANQNFNGATTTRVTGLQANKEYVFRLFAYDQYGNSSASIGEPTVVIRYRAKSENWRWYGDQQNETPQGPVADENVAPTQGSVYKLRMVLKENEGINGSNIKMRLQYSTYSDFSADVNYVGEIGSTTALWTYGDGIDLDNAPISTTLLVGAEIKGTHNESGISTSTFDHPADARAEFEFTIYNNNAMNATTYYFRAYDIDGREPVLVTNGFSYPSAVSSVGNLSYSIYDFNIGSSTEGVTANINSTAESINFGSLLPGEEAVGVQRFGISTNAGGGYQLFAYQKQNLISKNGISISPFVATNESPTSWSVAPSPSAFGYHTGDDTLSGTSPSRFAPDNSYAKFETNMKEISYSQIPVTGETVDLVYRLGVGDMQEAGDYETQIVYILVPTFSE